MLRSTRHGIVVPDTRARTIEALLDCAETCTVCADACLADDQAASLAACISLTLTCAEICFVAARVLERSLSCGQAEARNLLEACLQACAAVARECERHASHVARCRLCADRCRRCAKECQRMLERLSETIAVPPGRQELEVPIADLPGARVGLLAPRDREIGDHLRPGDGTKVAEFATTEASGAGRGVRSHTAV